MSTLTSMNTSRPDADLAAHVDARRIGQRRAGEHQLARASARCSASSSRELHLVVDAEHFGTLGAISGVTLTRPSPPSR